MIKKVFSVFLFSGVAFISYADDYFDFTNNGIQRDNIYANGNYGDSTFTQYNSLNTQHSIPKSTNPYPVKIDANYVRGFGYGDVGATFTF